MAWTVPGSGAVDGGAGGLDTASLRGRIGVALSTLADGWSFLFGREATLPAIDIVVVIEEDGVSVVRAGTDSLGDDRSPPVPVAQVGAAVASLARSEGLVAPVIALACAAESELVLRREIPYAPTRLLDGVAALQARAESPFPAGRTRIAWSRVAAGDQAQTLEIAILDGEIVEGVRDALREVDARVAFVVRVANGSLAWAATPDWLETTPQPAISWQTLLAPRWRPWVVAAGIVAGSIAANLAYSNLMLMGLGAQAGAAVETARQMAAMDADLGRIAQARVVSGQRFALMDALAKALDDNTSLASLSITRNSLEMQAVSPSAADVLRVVSAIPGLREPALKSGVAREGNRFERFTVSARIPDLPLAGDRQ